MYPLMGAIPNDLSIKINDGIGNQIAWHLDGSGQIAALNEGGLKCNRDHLPNLISKEFAGLLFNCLKSAVQYHDFYGDRFAFSFNVASKPILIVHERSLELIETSGMSLFDQWAFNHLEEMWKGRKL